MNWLVFMLILIVLIGPLRRRVFGRHTITFSVPAIIGGIVGLIYGCRAQASGAMIPGLPLICAFFGAGILGLACKDMLDDLFGSKK